MEKNLEKQIETAARKYKSGMLYDGEFNAFYSGVKSPEAKEYWFNTFIDEIIENETFLDFASKCASKKYEVGSKEHTITTMSIKFGMGCSLTKEYWQQGLYTEEEVFNLAWQLWEGFLHETKECPDYHTWFEQNKKK